MGICETSCNDCGYVAVNSFLSKCFKCGSQNVDREYEPDLDDASHFADAVCTEDFDEDDTRCGPER